MKRLAFAAMGALWCMALPRAEAPAADAQRRPNFAEHIAPILQARCISCHRPGQGGAFSLVSWDEVRARGKEIAEATLARRMPPWHAVDGSGYPKLRDDPRLTAREIAAIGNWVSRGMPSGDLKRRPPTASFPQTWPLGLPDVTMSLPRALAVPADSGDSYRTVIFAVAVPADLLISGIDYLPSPAGIVRHVRFFVAPPDLAATDDDVLPGVEGLLGSGSLENFGERLLDAAQQVTELGAWTPGTVRKFLPDGWSIRIPQRWNLIAQFHVKARDVDTVEDGRLALYYARPGSRRGVIPIDVPPASGFAMNLSLPAGQARVTVRDEFTLPIDVEAIGARGFAHLLAQDLMLSATLPNKRGMGLLRIERWNVDFPAAYYFAEPVRLPKGTTLRAEIGYDNSPANPRNLFTPPRPAGWGRLPAGEVASMALLIAEPPAADTKALAEAKAAHLKAQLLRR